MASSKLPDTLQTNLKSSRKFSNFCLDRGKADEKVMTTSQYPTRLQVFSLLPGYSLLFPFTVLLPITG